MNIFQVRQGSSYIRTTVQYNTVTVTVQYRIVLSHLYSKDCFHTWLLLSYMYYSIWVLSHIHESIVSYSADWCLIFRLGIHFLVFRVNHSFLWVKERNSKLLLKRVNCSRCSFVKTDPSRRSFVKSASLPLCFCKVWINHGCSLKKSMEQRAMEAICS